MIKKILFIFLLSSLGAVAQNKINAANEETYVSRKGVYQLKYDTNHWKRNAETSGWDASFSDNYDLLTAYFNEYDYFISEKDLKSTIKEQYKAYGDVKNLKIRKKKINGLEVNYFECELKFESYEYKYQGFVVNGKGGAMEIHFGVQKEGLTQYQALIDEFCAGLTVIK